MKYNNKLIILTIYFSSNNILFSLTNLNGDVIFWTTSGSRKVKGTKKISSMLILTVFKKIYKYITSFGYNYIYVKIKGFNKNKKVIIKYLKQSFLNILLISDLTSFPHNGCIKSNNRRI